MTRGQRVTPRATGGDPLLPDWSEDPWDTVDGLTDESVEELIDPGRTLAGPARLLAVVATASVLLCGAVGWWGVRQLNPAGEPGEVVNFTVNEGDGFDSVASRLEDAGIIVNKAVFKWYARSRGGIPLTPGYYAIRQRENAGRVVRILSTPPAQTFVSVTFPEGMTVAQMAGRLAEKMTFMKSEDFMAAASDGSIVSTLKPKGVATLEGLLFPDTYQVSGDDTESRVVARLAAMMERVAKQEGLADARRLVGLSPYQALIVASMIEREAKVPQDRAKIARVIYNRLAKKMNLEIDATLKYGADPSTPFAELKANDTPYNTYLRKGLPPTPIANPGRASIKAALAPSSAPSPEDEACQGLKPGVECDYYYYVLIDASGRHAFATTYEQHLKNIERARAAGVLP